MMDTETNYLLVGILLGWITLVIGFFLYRFAYQRWRKGRYGTFIDHNDLLTQYCRKLTGIEDRETLDRLLTDEVPHILKVIDANLLIPEVHQLITIQKDDLRLPVSHAAVRWVASSGEAQRADRGHLRELIQQSRTDLTWTQVWVPLMRGSRLRGLWLLGQRQDGLLFSPEDLKI